MNDITSFRGKYRFLSNFYPSPVTLDGIEFPTVEHAYQAAKTHDLEERRRIAAMKTPSEAKHAGKGRGGKNWPTHSLGYMRCLLWRKFQHPELAKQLLDTGDARIVEGNTWNDTFWGECPLGTGENHLGKMLMQVRDSLRRKRSYDRE